MPEGTNSFLVFIFNLLNGDSFETVKRIFISPRILFKNSYFDYPLTPVNALFGLGLFESIIIGFLIFLQELKAISIFLKLIILKIGW